MNEARIQAIWKEQCDAARRLCQDHGVLSALDYLLGEKLLTFAETAAERPEFAAQLPRFVAEVRDIFSRQELRSYLEHLERMHDLDDEAGLEATDDDVLILETPEQRAAARERLSWLKELLTLDVLGTA